MPNFGGRYSQYSPDKHTHMNCFSFWVGSFKFLEFLSFSFLGLLQCSLPCRKFCCVNHNCSNFPWSNEQARQRAIFIAVFCISSQIWWATCCLLLCQIWRATCCLFLWQLSRQQRNSAVEGAPLHRTNIHTAAYWPTENGLIVIELAWYTL